MNARNITEVIGPQTYYEQVGGTKSFSNGDQEVAAYLVKITKTDNELHKDKYALIKSTKQAGGEYITDITYGKECDLLGKINTADNVNLQTRTFNGTVSVDDLSKEAGAKKPTENTSDKAWNLAANKPEWQGLGASVPQDVTQACSAPAAGTPAAGSAPAVSENNLGEVNADDANAKVDIKFDKNIAAVDSSGSIIIKVNDVDKTLESTNYAITENTLSINKSGITALGITNETAANTLIVNANQIADKVDPTKKNLVTGALQLKAKAPGSGASANAAPDNNLEANIITPPNSEFPQSGPIELTFQNNLELADGKKLADQIFVMELDSSGNEIPNAGQKDLTYEVVGGKQLKISQPSGSQFKPATKYKVSIQPGTFLNDDGSKPNTDHIGYTFKAITPLVRRKYKVD